MSQIQQDNVSDEDNIADKNEKVQMGICEADGAFNPLVETLKEDPLLKGAVVEVVKVCGNIPLEFHKFCLHLRTSAFSVLNRSLSLI